MSQEDEKMYFGKVWVDNKTSPNMPTKTPHPPLLSPKPLYHPSNGGVKKDDWYMSINNERAVQMIAMRLRIENGHLMPFKHISAHVDNEVAVVFVLGKDNKPISIEDDVNLFPSDQLITQLRLIAG